MAGFRMKSLFYQLYKRGIINLILLALPFMLMDFIIRVLSLGVKYNMPGILIPNILFTFIWVCIIVSFSLMCGHTVGRIIYGTIFLLFFISFFAQLVYYPYTGFFFSFNLTRAASEGSAYILSTLAHTSLFVYISSAAVLALGIVVTVKFPNYKRAGFKAFIIILVVFTVFHFIIPIFFGEMNKSLEWDTWRNPRNVYDSFSDSNKCIKICGFFEYTVRDFYVTFLRPKVKAEPDESKFLDAAYAMKTPHKKNPYSGIFKGKNVIFLQLEGIDTWLMTSETMPNLYSMKKNALVFDSHYSYYTGGGSTFNSELAVITSFLTPFSYNKNPYLFNTNYFPGSLPNVLKKAGYSCNAFHMNSGEYYMREKNYINWGFDNYYSLVDDGNYSDMSYQLDRELVQNELFYEKLFLAEEPFMHYIITYTPHTPFSLDSKMGALLADTVYGTDVEKPEMTEEEVVRFFASETDYMIGLLFDALEENNLLDNTVIVAFADHYLYTLSDKSILDAYKRTDNNMINRTPFLIWSKELSELHVGKVNSQVDILPTVLNMLGVEFYDEYYIGRDIMDRKYGGYVFFSDYSWYDGINYYELDRVINNRYADPTYVDETNVRINNIIRKNDLTLKYNHFKKLKDREKISNLHRVLK